MDAICDRFEAALRAGKRPRIETSLEGVEHGHAELLEHLLRAELEQARAEGNDPNPLAYLARFPAFTSTVVRAFQKTLGKSIVVDEVLEESLRSICVIHCIRQRFADQPVDERTDSLSLLNAIEEVSRSPKLPTPLRSPVSAVWVDSFRLQRRFTDSDHETRVDRWFQLLDSLISAFSPKRAAILKECLAGREPFAVGEMHGCSSATVLATCRYACDLLSARLDR